MLPIGSCRLIPVHNTYASDTGGELDYSDLPPILRVLLVTDGTVTRILEAWFNEPVLLQSLHQQVMRADAEQPWINTDKGDEILQREIRLVGSNSGKVYLEAVSLVHLEKLGDTLVEKLLPGKVGIGELLHEHGVGTHREMLWTNLSCSGGPANEPATVSRSYRIFIDDVACILVTERFPISAYQLD